MLGSTADSLFWMFRYIERVENTLCMIESGFQLYLLSSSNLYNEWDAILRTNSIRHHFLKKNNSLDSLKIINFMFKDSKNLNNILILFGKARENARRSRVSITSEVWEAINTCWLYLNEELNKKINESKIQIIKAQGQKCDRCWHYQKETFNGIQNTKLCKRCSNIINFEFI